MINAQFIKLNMNPSGVLPVLYCSQYDIGRPLGVSVYDSNAAVDLSQYTATIEAERTDGTAIVATVTTNGNAGTFSTTATMTNKADKYFAQLVLTQSGKRVASIPFVMCVVPAAMDENSTAIHEDASLFAQFSTSMQSALASVTAESSANSARIDNMIALQTEGSMQGSKITTFTAQTAVQYTSSADWQSFSFCDYSLHYNTTPSMSVLDGLSNPVLLNAGAYILASQSASITDEPVYVNLTDDVRFYNHGYLGAAPDKRAVEIAVPKVTDAAGDISGMWLLFVFSVVSDVPVDLSEVTDVRVGADGTTYSTAGAAVRDQVETLNGKISQIGVPYTEYDAQNLFDKNAVHKGYYYNASGEKTALSTYCYTDYIPLEANSYYRWSSHGIFNYYDSNKNWVASETKSTSAADYSSGVNTTAYPSYAYVIISTEISNLDVFMIVNSNIAPTQYKPFQYESVMRIADNSAPARSMEFAEPYYLHGNVFNKDAAHFDGHYYDTDGTKKVQAKYGYTELIPVYGGIRYYATAPCFICYYASDQSFISGAAITNPAGGAFDTGATTAYVRLSIDRQYKDTFLVCTHPIVESIPFRYAINEDYVRVKKPTDGKKVVCVGDSLTQGVDYVNNTLKENYPYFMSQMLGCAIINYGKSGASSLAWWQNYRNSCPFDPSMDVVIIMFGTNGGLQNNTLSTDVEPYDNPDDYAETAVGCYCKLIEHIMTDTSNHAQIILMTPPYSTYNATQERNVINSEATIRAIAKRYSVPVIDVLNECGMGKFNGSVFRPHDGCHFNAKGYHRLGTFVGSQVLSLFSEFDLNESYDDEHT